MVLQSLVKNKQDWLGDTIKALRAAQTPNNKTLGVFLCDMSEMREEMSFEYPSGGNNHPNVRSTCCVCTQSGPI